MSSLGVPAVVHKTIRAPVEKSGQGDVENMNSLAQALKAAVEEVMTSASRAFSEAQADQYGFNTTAPAATEAGTDQPKTLHEAMDKFEDLCDRMYMLVDGARHVLLQRVNDTHDSAKNAAPAAADQQQSQGDEGDTIKVDAAAVAYTTAVASQVRCARQTKDILAQFWEGYQRQVSLGDQPGGGLGVPVTDALGAPLADLGLSLDNLAALSAAAAFPQ